LEFNFTFLHLTIIDISLSETETTEKLKTTTKVDAIPRIPTILVKNV